MNTRSKKKNRITTPPVVTHLGIYSRVSTEEQANKGISLDAQITGGKTLAMNNSWEPIIYQDAGLSGSLPPDKRPGLQKMLTDIAMGKIQAVWVLQQDRLSRGNMIEQGFIKDIFKDNMIRFFENGAEIDLKDPSQALLSDLKSLLSNFEIRKGSFRVSTTLLDNARKGKVGGGALLPYGYTKDEDKFMIVDDNEAPIIRQIYQLALDGKGTKAIATILNAAGVKTRRQKAMDELGKGEITLTNRFNTIVKTSFVWTDTVIYQILTNPIYYGKRRYKGDLLDCPAIITENVFRTAADILKNRNQFIKNTTNKHTYMLKGLLYCSHCGNRFYGRVRAVATSTSNGRYQYECNSRRHNTHKCSNMCVKMQWLDEFVLDYVDNLEDTTERAFLSASNDSIKKRKLADFDKTKEDIATVDRRKNNLMLMGMDATPETLKDITNSIETLNVERAKLVSTLDNLSKEIGVFNHKDTIISYVKQTVADFRKLKTIDEKIVALQNIIDRITIRWDGQQHIISIYYRLDNIARYEETKTDIYLLGTEQSVPRTNRNHFGEVVNQQLWLTSFYLGVDEEGTSLDTENIRYLNPHVAHGEQWNVIKSGVEE